VTGLISEGLVDLSEVQEKANGIIWYIAARRCLKENLELLYENFNNEYKYPVIVYSFGDVYSERFKKDVWSRLDPDIQFVTLDVPELPANVPESELFYNRTDIEYVRKFFPPSRVGYLHTNNFVAGYVMNHPGVAQYDYGLKMDDDTFFVKKVPNDILLEASKNGYVYSPSDTMSFNRERARQTQVGIRDLFKEYLSEENLVPVSDSIDETGEWNGDGPYDPTVWDFRIFRDEKWDVWWRKVDESGGMYKYRWGDLEVHTLFVKTHYPDTTWHDMELYDRDIVIHGGYGPVYTWQQSIVGRIIHNILLSPRAFTKKILRKVFR
jgi:hypothetical protein